MIVDKIELRNEGSIVDPFPVYVIEYRDEHDEYKRHILRAEGVNAEDFMSALEELVDEYVRNGVIKEVVE